MEWMFPVPRSLRLVSGAIPNQEWLGAFTLARSRPVASPLSPLTTKHRMSFWSCSTTWVTYMSTVARRSDQLPPSTERVRFLAAREICDSWCILLLETSRDSWGAATQSLPFSLVHFRSRPVNGLQPPGPRFTASATMAIQFR